MQELIMTLNIKDASSLPYKLVETFRPGLKNPEFDVKKISIDDTPVYGKTYVVETVKDVLRLYPFYTNPYRIATVLGVEGDKIEVFFSNKKRGVITRTKQPDDVAKELFGVTPGTELLFITGNSLNSPGKLCHNITKARMMYEHLHKIY